MKSNPDVCSTLAEHICETYDRDWCVVLSGNADETSTDLTLVTHPKLGDHANAVRDGLTDCLQFMARLLRHADGEQLPSGLRQLVDDVARLTET